MSKPLTSREVEMEIRLTPTGHSRATIYTGMDKKKKTKPPDVFSSVLIGPAACSSTRASGDSMSTLTSSGVKLDDAWPFRFSLLIGSSEKKKTCCRHTFAFTSTTSNFGDIEES